MGGCYCFILAPEDGLFSNRNIGQICLNYIFLLLFFCLLLHRLAVSYFSKSCCCTDPGLQQGDPAPLIGLSLWTCWFFNIFWCLFIVRLELSGQTSPFLRRIPLLIRTIQSEAKLHSRQRWVLVKISRKNWYFIFKNIWPVWSRAPQCTANREGNYITFNLHFLALSHDQRPRFSKFPVTFRAWKAVLCLPCLYSRSNFQ